MPGDIDAGDHSLFGELRHLLEGGIADDKMPSQCVRLSNFGVQHIALADLKRNMCAQHRYWRETPQQDQQLRRHARESAQRDRHRRATGERSQCRAIA